MTDNSQFMSKVVDWITVFLEIVALQIKLLVYTIQAFLQFVIPPDEKPVNGEKILITGTGHGIGKELAKQYGELGATVICVDINPETNKQTVLELRKKGIKAHKYECDVSNREKVLELAKKVQEEVGDVTVLVNNAGIMPVKRLGDHSADDIKRIFDINVFAHFWLMEAFLPSMIEKNYGHIIGLSSIAGLIGLPNIVPYCGSKFAVRGMMEAAAEEYRKLGFNINFLTVYPYMTDTGLCKNPKVKFPNAFPIQKPEDIAANVIRAHRCGYREVQIPYIMRPLHNYGRLLPEKAQMSVIDFLDSGVSAD
ncbi:UNVERIFIED_CONTAM: hypothetical protein PYX00_010003 [Menopon gallinae]|uniref:Short-chain dehydrogenase/reductase 3 n=1 Tax=Menopon gallinae TaxID=328185 RepID=A0AAW2HDV1_9NEOP